MRIAHLITRLDRGGSAINTLLSAIHQAERGHKVFLVAGRKEPMPENEAHLLARDLARFQQAGGRLLRVPLLVRAPGVHDLAALFALVRVLSRLRPDLVHTHTSKAGALGRIAARMLGIPVVHTPHGHIFGGYFPRPVERAFLLAERVLAPLATRLVALTDTERREQLALGIGKPEQWVVIPSGVDVETIAARVAAVRAEGAKAEFLAVCVARLVHVKGVDRVIRAWPHVLAKQKDARLAIVGEGKERKALMTLAEELGVAPFVHFAGFDDPARWLARARLFVLLSRNEGQGRALVEAMAAGLPVVVGGAPALAEVAGNAGRVVDADDPKAVAEAIVRPWPEDAAAKARARAQRYSLAAMFAALDRLYAEVLA